MPEQHLSDRFPHGKSSFSVKSRPCLHSLLELTVKTRMCPAQDTPYTSDKLNTPPLLYPDRHRSCWIKFRLPDDKLIREVRRTPAFSPLNVITVWRDSVCMCALMDNPWTRRLRGCTIPIQERNTVRHYGNCNPCQSNKSISDPCCPLGRLP
jgi:hypothetical protein